MPFDQKQDEARSEADALDDLESQKATRVHERYNCSVKLLVHPGSSSSSFPAVSGVTADLSSGGCRAAFPKPLLVGDVYRLEFPESDPKIPTVFARCVRCRLIHDSAFEAGFAFFQLLDLGSSATSGGLLD